jgi:hypothetical protein
MTAAIAAGEVRPVDPRQTLLSVLSCCLFFFIERMLHLHPEPVESNGLPGREGSVVAPAGTRVP